MTMSESILTLEQFYDFIAKHHSYKYVDILDKLIRNHVARETQTLRDNIDIYSMGFEQAVDDIDYLQMRSNDFTELNYDDVAKAERLNYLIYKDYFNPNYSAKLKEV